MSRWPHPGDTALDRARKLANNLLTLLPEQIQQRAVSRAHVMGETWLGGGLSVVDEADELTTEQASGLVAVSTDVIRKWACTPHPEPGHGGPLLPRFGYRGRQRTYLARDVLAAAGAVRRAREQRRA
jgi:hypothetical protein